MPERFSPHPKNPNILVGKTYKIPNYKKPWDCHKAMREEMEKRNIEICEVS